MEFQVRQLAVGGFDHNFSYLVTAENGDAALVDPTGDAEIIRRAMARLGLAPERARIALCAPSQSAALEAAARELSKDVRYLALCAPNGERLVFANKQAGKSYFLIDLNASV